MIVSPPVSCSTYVASASAATLVWMRSCVVIGVKGSGCSDRCELCVTVSVCGVTAGDDPVM